MRDVRRAPRALALLAAGALLAGCGGAPEAAPPPTQVTATPTETTSAPPPEPDLRSERSEAGAEAAVEWFLASMKYAGQTGDSSAFRQTYDDSCTKCEAIAAGIDSTYQAGGKITGGGWTPFDFNYYGIRNDVGYIDAYVNYEAQTFTETSTSSPRRFPAQKNVLKAFQLRWADGWTVGALDPEL